MREAGRDRERRRRARPGGWLVASGARTRAGGRRRGINADDVVVETKPAGRLAGGGGFPVHEATGGMIAVAFVQMMHDPTP